MAAGRHRLHGGRWAVALVTVVGLWSCGPKPAQTPRPRPRVAPRPRPILAEAGEPCANDQGCEKGLRCRQGMCLHTGGGRQPAPRGGALGIPACDAVLALYRCYLSKLPPAASAAAGQAFQRIRAAWAKALASRRAGTRQTIVQGCQRALQALRRSMANHPKFRRCLGP